MNSMMASQKIGKGNNAILCFYNGKKYQTDIKLGKNNFQTATVKQKMLI
jgi:hypothetical protein